MMLGEVRAGLAFVDPSDCGSAAWAAEAINVKIRRRFFILVIGGTDPIRAIALIGLIRLVLMCYKGSGKQLFASFAFIGQFEGAAAGTHFLIRGVNAEAPGDRGVEISNVQNIVRG